MLVVEKSLSDVAVIVDADDEFGEDYEDPGTLTPADVSGAVVYTLDWTVSSIVSQIDADPNDPESVGVIVTAPPFQRRTAWTDERQSLFIESLMLGLPVPPLVLAESMRNAGQFYVLDGKQRLTALKRFFTDSSPLRLRGLELLRNTLQGRTYQEAKSDQDLRKYTKSLLTQPIRTIVVRNWATPSLLHLIFSRLNKASVPLASHELRQAIYPGSFTNYINRRSGESSMLLKARRLESPDFRLRDAETLLRFIAFKCNLRKYRGDLRDFLDRSLKGGNDNYFEIDEDLEQLVATMENAIDTVFEIFGDAAFLRFDPGREKYMPRFNVTVFDLMTWFFTDHRVSEAARRRSDGVSAAFESLCRDDDDFAAYLTSTTKTAAATVGRLEKWGATLSDVLDLELPVDDFAETFLPLAPRGSR